MGLYIVFFETEIFHMAEAHLVHSRYGRSIRLFHSRCIKLASLLPKSKMRVLASFTLEILDENVRYCLLSYFSSSIN